MSRVQTISGIIVLLVAGCIEAGAQAFPERPTKHVDVSRIVNEYADAWNKHDMNTLGELFAPRIMPTCTALSRREIGAVSLGFPSVTVHSDRVHLCSRTST